MNNSSPIFSIPYLPLLVRLQCRENVKLPAFLGSTLHGITGWALLQNKEAYQYLFENKKLNRDQKDIVNPYLIQPPRSKTTYLSGDMLCFHFVLFGDASRYATNIVDSFSQVQQFKLGAQRKAFELVDMLHGERFNTIWQNNHFNSEALIASNIDAYTIQDHASWCSIHLLTPVRIRRKGELLQQLDFATIIRNITRRVKALVERYGGYVDEYHMARVCELATQVHCRSSSFHIHEMHRYSNRKKQSMEWNGLLGTMTFEGELSPFIPWLNVARILHIGRNSTLGYGQIDVIYS